MNSQFGIFIIILMGAGISSVVEYLISKSKVSIRKFLFWGLVHYFVLSVIKSYLHSPELSLIQSFWDANSITYIHYSEMIGIISVVSPIIAHFVFRNKLIAFIDWNVSISIIAFPIITLIYGNMPNILFVILFLILSVASFILGLKAPGALIFQNKAEMVATIKSNWPIALIPVFLTLFYFPNELYLTNIRDFYNPYLEFVVVLLVATVLMASIIMFFMCILPTKWVKIVATVVFAVSICSYLQYLLMNGSLDVMLGKHQQWDPMKFILNIIIWLIIIIVLVILDIKKDKAKEVMKWTSIFLMAVLSITVMTLIAQNVNSFDRQDGVLVHDGDLTLAPDNNVLVFVLDMYDYRFFKSVIEMDPEFADELKDFVLYDDAIARHPYTDFSIPYLLTGSEWREDAARNFQDYAYDGDTMLSRIASTGVDIGVYTDMMHFNESQSEVIRNYRDDVVRETDIESTISIMTKTSLYKMMPFIIKEKYFYDTSDMSWMVKYGEVWTDYNDVPFYERIVNDRLSVDDSLSGTFRFYHMRGVHYPFYLSEDIHNDRTRSKVTAEEQAKGSMKIVYYYLEQLKELGLYDNATIVITADHGDIISCDSDNKKMSAVSRPILFIKQPNSNNDALIYNHAEVSHKELIPTILDAYNLDYSMYGPRLEDIEEDEVRERYFGYYTVGEGVVTGAVYGNGADVNNWKVD